jgi:hypothetical protein
MGKHNNTGRSKGGGRFVQLHEYVARSYAWRRLPPLAKVAWFEIGFIYNGSNNGKLAIPSRRLAEHLDVSPSAAAKAIRDLIKWGFVDHVKASSFSQKRLAAEYRLTHVRCDVTGQPASKRFLVFGKPDLIPMARAAE